MKNIYCLLFIFLFIHILTGQELNIPYTTIAEKVAAKKSKSSAIIDDLFVKKNLQDLNIKKQKLVESAELFTINAETIEKITEKKSAGVSISIPYYFKNNSPIVLDLLRVKNSFGERKLNNTNNLHLRGVVRGFEKESLVALSTLDDEVMGFVSISGEVNLTIGKSPTGDFHVIYDEIDLKRENDWSCKSISAPKAQLSTIDRELKSNVNRTLEDAIIKVFFVVDYDIYSHFNFNDSDVNNFVEGQFNQVAAVYENEGINIEISKIEILKSPDNYGTNPLFDFLADYPSFDGHLAHLLSYQAVWTNRGGQAYLAGLCFPTPGYSYGESRIEFDYEIYPTYSSNIATITHELGHNLGSQHTQACVWNNNCTAIDGCANSEISVPCSTNCPSAPLPSGAPGSIMSYCHRVSSIKRDFNFGTQPGNRIRQHILNSDCLFEKAVLGDVNDDGVANIIDALLINQYIVDVRDAVENCENWDFNPANRDLCIENADVNGDGKIDVIDCLFIGQCEATICNVFCPNCD